MPVSRGFLLEMERAFLQEWVEANGLSLWINVKVERSITKYREESEMDWEERSEVIALNFLQSSDHPEGEQESRE